MGIVVHAPQSTNFGSCYSRLERLDFSSTRNWYTIDYYMLDRLVDDGVIKPLPQDDERVSKMDRGDKLTTLKEITTEP